MHFIFNLSDVTKNIKMYKSEYTCILLFYFNTNVLSIFRNRQKVELILRVFHCQCLYFYAKKKKMIHLKKSFLTSCNKNNNPLSFW